MKIKHYVKETQIPFNDINLVLSGDIKFTLYDQDMMKKVIFLKNQSHI